MSHYEYKVVPAPTKGLKVKAVKTPEGRFALTIQDVLNALGAEGWEYLRAELLPSEERSGLTGSTINWRNVLVFRREITPPVSSTQAATSDATDDPKSEPLQLTGAKQMLKDDGVEELSPVSGMTAALKSRAKQQTGEPEDDAQAADEATEPKS